MGKSRGLPAADGRPDTELPPATQEEVFAELSQAMRNYARLEKLYDIFAGLRESPGDNVPLLTVSSDGQACSLAVDDWPQTAQVALANLMLENLNNAIQKALATLVATATEAQAAFNAA